MKITNISIKKLFGLFDYDIDFNQTEQLTILTGPNGYGKTTILNIINNLFEEYQLITKNDLWTNILEESSFSGYIRWYNDKTDCRLNFKKLSFGELLGEKLTESVSVNQSGLIEAINKRSSNKKNVITAPIIKEFISDNKTTDYLNLCNGHDVVNILSHVIGPQVSEKELRRHLRISFRIEEFAQTKLYSHLQNWEIKTGFELLANS